MISDFFFILKFFGMSPRFEKFHNLFR